MEIPQWVKVDLEGDGVLSNHILTKADGASLNAPPPNLEIYRIWTFANLNGDGRMEIVVSSRDLAGSGTAVWEIASDVRRPIKVLEGRCGS